MQGKLKQLEDDFKYNLRLIQARDEELSRYEQLLATNQDGLEQQQMELSESQLRLAEALESLTAAKLQLQENQLDHKRSMEGQRVGDQVDFLILDSLAFVC